MTEDWIGGLARPFADVIERAPLLHSPLKQVARVSDQSNDAELAAI